MSRVGNTNVLALAKSSPLGAASSLSLQTILKTAPGFSRLQDFFKTWLKLDVASLAVYVTLFGAFSGGASHLDKIYSRLRSWVVRFFTASISIPGTDELNQEVLNWVGSNVLQPRRTRILTAQSRTTIGEYGGVSTQRDDVSSDGEKTIRYMPTFSTTWFSFDRNLFMVRRDADNQKSKGFQADQYSIAPKWDEPLLIMCLGRSVDPIKKFLTVCQKSTADQRKEFVTVHVDKLRGLGRWDTVILRPFRMLDTVHLDKSIKDELIADIETYLQPETRKFYTERGIPYRRGYLLHGPPGTGKTSISIALAWHFKVDLYMVHLPTLYGDNTLQILFMLLPPRSIVLIEDIDCVGLKREIAKKKEIDEDERPDCTLSGLLNVLDGVTAPQGRIVLMTSNAVDDLDEALLRPGRIDKRVYMGNISKEAARVMFLKFYAPSHGIQKPPSVKLQKLAAEFSDRIPDEVFSPAQIQEYLLSHRKEAAAAISKFPEWIVEEQARMKARKERERQLEEERIKLKAEEAKAK